MASDKSTVIALMNEAAKRIGGSRADILRRYAGYLENDPRLSAHLDSDGNFVLRIARDPLSNFELDKVMTVNSTDGSFTSEISEPNPKPAVIVENWIQPSLLEGLED